MRPQVQQFLERLRTHELIHDTIGGFVGVRPVSQRYPILTAVYIYLSETPGDIVTMKLDEQLSAREIINATLVAEEKKRVANANHCLDRLNSTLPPSS